MISPTEAVGVPRECIEVATYGQKLWMTGSTVIEIKCRELELVRIISKRTGSSQDDVIARRRKTPPTRIKRVRSLE